MGLSCTYLPVGAQGVDLKSPTAAGKYSDRRRVSTPPPAAPRPWSQLHLQKFHEHHNSMNPTFEKRPLPTKGGPHPSGGIRLLPLPFEDDISDDRSTFEGIASWPFHIPLEPAAPPIAFHQTPLHGQEYDSDYRRYFPELAVKHPRVPYSPSSPDVYLGYACMIPSWICVELKPYTDRVCVRRLGADATAGAERHYPTLNRRLTGVPVYTFPSALDTSFLVSVINPNTASLALLFPSLHLPVYHPSMSQILRFSCIMFWHTEL
jgi:hypothetical protein